MANNKDMYIELANRIYDLDGFQNSVMIYP